MRAAVLALSASVLAHEVCLLRVLSIADWHHAATLVVSVALLGFGASGTLLALVPRLRAPATVAVGAALHALLLHLAPRAAGAAGFDVLRVGWEPSQWVRLLATQAVWFAPFLAAGTAIGAAISLAATRPGPTYAANLLGSGIGAAAAPLLLDLGPPEDVLRGVAALSAASALLVPLRARFAGVAALAAVAAVPAHALPMSPFKALPSAPGKTVLSTDHGPLGRVDRALVPALHFAPGLSLLSPALPGPQEGLFVDGHLVAALDREGSTHLDHALGAFPFVAFRTGPTLLLGVGPDLEREGTTVDPNADLLRAAGAAGIVLEPRAFLRATTASWHAIVHHVSDLHPAAETPLLTVEGLATALERTAPDGFLAVSCSVSTPPRAAAKLLATADVAAPHVVAVRSSDRLCVALRRRAPTADERERTLAFCEEHAFDPVRPADWALASPHHVTDVPLGRAPPEDYPYDVRPATDARPYFHTSFRWSRIGDVFVRDRIPFVQWGYVALVVALAQVTALSLLLTVVPLATARAARGPAGPFAALGLAYMLVEMAYLQRAMLRTGSPVHAAAAVVGGFLLGSGLGSLAAERLGRPLRAAALVAAALAPVGYLLLPSSPALAAALCAVVAFPMGMPFPAALARLPPSSVPWALAWNGCASVFAASAAPLLSTTWGIAAAAAAGALAYVAVAAGLAPRPVVPGARP